jgi:hypothetical protein
LNFIALALTTTTNAGNPGVPLRLCFSPSGSEIKNEDYIRIKYLDSGTHRDQSCFEIWREFGNAIAEKLVLKISDFG